MSIIWWGFTDWFIIRTLPIHFFLQRLSTNKNESFKTLLIFLHKKMCKNVHFGFHLLRVWFSKMKCSGEITNGTDWTGPRPDGPAIGSFGCPESDDIFGLVIPLAAGRPLDDDVHVEVVVALLYELLPTWAIDVELLFAPVKETPFEFLYV